MKLTKIILINIAIILLILMLLEWGVRWIAGERINYQGSSREIFQDSVYFDSFGLKPNSTGVVFGTEVRINRFGLRGSPANLDMDQPVILLIGDSVLFGVGVADSLTIYANLQKQFQDSVSFINTAVIGYGLYDYKNVIRYWLQRVRPQRIYLFYTLNDLYSASIDMIQERPTVVEAVFNVFRTQSKLYLWIKNGLLDRGKSFFLYDYGLYSQSNHYFTLAHEKISGIARLCNDLDIPLIVFILPYRYQYMDDMGDPWKPQRLIKEMWQQNNIITVDAREAFPSGNADQYYLYGDPMHLSSAGHFRLTEFILQTEMTLKL